MNTLPPDLPHDFTDDESRWLSDEHVKREIYKPSYRSTYILYLLLGVAAFIGIVIGALS